MTFLNAQQRLARRRGAKDSTLNTATATRYKETLNEAHRAILRKPGRESLRYGVITFASVASQKLYALPEQGIARINRITETTNDRRMVYQTPDWLDAMAPDPTTGTPWAWIPRGLSSVHTQPSDASEIFVDSTSASDTNTAYIEGFITGGYYRTASVSMTGTTAITLSSTITNFIHITKFYLSAAAVGIVTLHEDATGGTELSRIAIGDVAPKFTTFQLYNTPAAVVTYTADVLRSIPEMANDTDEFLLPVDFEDLVVDMAELRELRKSDDPNRWQMLQSQVKEGDAALQTFLVGHPDWRPTWTPRLHEYSALGAWFPAGT